MESKQLLEKWQMQTAGSEHFLVVISTSTNQ